MAWPRTTQARSFNQKHRVFSAMAGTLCQCGERSPKHARDCQVQFWKSVRYNPTDAQVRFLSNMNHTVLFAGTRYGRSSLAGFYASRRWK